LKLIEVAASVITDLEIIVLSASYGEMLYWLSSTSKHGAWRVKLLGCIGEGERQH
jgi:hypothetical protein